jgi:hypothetical protein
MLTSAVWFNVTAYGFDLTDGTTVGWLSAYPSPSFDEDPARLSSVSARWNGRHFVAGAVGDQICLAIRNLTAPSPSAKSLSVGATVTLVGASLYNQPTVSRTFTLTTFTSTPSVTNVETCVNFYYLSCPALAAPAQGGVSYNASAPFYYRTVATFTCNGGYTLSGSSTAVCDVINLGAAAPTDTMNLRFAFDTSAASSGSASAALATFGAPVFKATDGAPSVFFDNPTSVNTMSTNYYRANTGLTSGAGWTVAVWVNPINVYYTTILGMRNDWNESNVAYQPGFQMDLFSDSSLTLFTAAPAAWTITPTAAAGSVKNNTWTHIAFSFSNAFVGTLYIDGVQVAQQTGTGAVPGYTRLVMGGSGDRGRGYHGSISDVRLYARVLSAAEITTVRAKYAGSWSSAAPVCNCKFISRSAL